MYGRLVALQWAGNLSMFIFNIICDIYVLDMFLNNVFKWNLYVSDVLDKIYFLFGLKRSNLLPPGG